MSQILGASHIVCGVSGKDQAEALVSGLGRLSLYGAEAQPIPAEKIPFLSRTLTIQSAIYTHHEKGIGVEALWHDSSVAAQDVMPFSPVVASDGSVELVEISSGDPDETERFLVEAFGFQKKSNRRLLVPSLLRRELELVFVSRPNVVEPYLDFNGYSCLSFDVKRLSAALESCARSGAQEIGQPFSHTTPQRVFQIAFVRSPTGELYELLETTKVTR